MRTTPIHELKPAIHEPTSGAGPARQYFYKKKIMRKIAFVLLAATFWLAACKKQSTSIPATNTVHITDADFRDCKTTIPGLHAKKSDDGMELDYDLVVKEIAANKYEAAMKINGVKLNGKKLNGYKASAIVGVVLALNTSKEDKTVPLEVLLKSDDNSTGSDKIITFPAFEYKGDLAYELLEVATSITINNGNFKVYDNVNVSFFGENLTITGGNIIFSDNSTILLSDSKTTVPTNFSLLLKDSKPVMEDKTTVFVMPNGHTITQAPVAAKVVIEEEEDGSLGYITVTISGDPARYITSISYQPCTADGTTKDPKEEPVMQFEATHFNEQNGVQRFKSKERYAALYHKSRAKFHYSCMQHWHGSTTRVDVIPTGEIRYVSK